MKLTKLSHSVAMFLSLVIGTGTVALTSVSYAEEHTSTHELVEMNPSDFKPAFTKDTVVKLNSIVERAYAVIGEFDELKKELNTSPKLYDVSVNPSGVHNESQLARMRELESRSSNVLADMSKAVVQLKASEEHYNPAVLAGMVIFVETVDKEIRQFNR